MKWIIAALAALFLLLQYQLWFADGGRLEVHRLEQQVAEQRARVERQRERNDALEAEVEDLKRGLDAIEARARGELGMIREDETFYQVVEPGVGESSEGGSDAGESRAGESGAGESAAAGESADDAIEETRE